MQTVVWVWVKRQLLLGIFAGMVLLSIAWAVYALVRDLTGWLPWLITSALGGLTVVSALWVADVRGWWDVWDRHQAREQRRIDRRLHALRHEWLRHPDSPVVRRHERRRRGGLAVYAVIVLAGIALLSAWVIGLSIQAAALWYLWTTFGISIALIVVGAVGLARQSRQRISD